MSKRLRADLALALASLIWGTTFVLVKGALANSSIFVFLAVRFSLAALLMLPMLYRSLRTVTSKTVLVGAKVGIFMFGGFAFQTAGLRFTTPSKTAFITGSCVVLVPIFLGLSGARRIAVSVWIGAATAFVGLYFLTVPTEGLGSLNIGDVLVFGCAVVFALHIIFIGRYAGAASATMSSFLQIAMTAALAIITAVAFSAAGWESPHFVATPGLIAAVFIISVGATIICFSLQIWAQKYASPSHTAIFISLEPVFAAITTRLVLNEHLGGRALTGAALILGGILIAELLGPSQTIPESPEPIVRVAGE